MSIVFSNFSESKSRIPNFVHRLDGSLCYKRNETALVLKCEQQLTTKDQRCNICLIEAKRFELTFLQTDSFL